MWEIIKLHNFVQQPIYQCSHLYCLHTAPPQQEHMGGTKNTLFRAPGQGAVGGKPLLLKAWYFTEWKAHSPCNGANSAVYMLLWNTVLGGNHCPITYKTLQRRHKLKAYSKIMCVHAHMRMWTHRHNNSRSPIQVFWNVSNLYAQAFWNVSKIYVPANLGSNFLSQCLFNKVRVCLSLSTFPFIQVKPFLLPWL